MGLKKGVASQKIKFVMVDKTDFATPEPGITVQGGLSKDGGAKASIVNSVSEIYSGLYVYTPQDSEIDCDCYAFRFHDGGTACATQHIIGYTEELTADLSGLESLLDSAIDGPITSILADTKTTLPATLSGLESTLDSAIDGPLTSILADTKTTLPATLSGLESTLDSAIDGPITSILADTKTLSNATYGLDALETLTSDILEALDSVVAGPIASILVDTNTTLDNKIDSILADTITLSNATYGLNALETITSDIYSALSDFEATNATTLTAITSDIAAVYSALSDCEATLASDITAVYSALSDFEAAAPTATEIVDAFESQCQADPTGFHVNLKEINGTAVAGDGGGTPWGP